MQIEPKCHTHSAQYNLREANIAHAQLIRMQCSNLNGHLYNFHVIDSPKCSCSYKCEDSNHYLFHCPLYTTERCKMLDTVNKICSGNVDLNLLLHGGHNKLWITVKTKPLKRVLNCIS